MAADNDPRRSIFAAAIQKPGPSDLRLRGKSRVTVQRTPPSRCNDQGERKQDQQRDARRAHGADQLPAPLRVVGVSVPVRRDARELGVARMHLVEQQEDHRGQVDRRARERIEDDGDE